MADWIDRRCAGVLLHVSALPGPFKRGVIGAEAYAFIDFIADAGFAVWQFLPLGPTHDHGSPYESMSCAAGNPEFIDLRDCVKRGWLSDARCQACIEGDLSFDVALNEASEGFWQQVECRPSLSKQLDEFLLQTSDWLGDYSLYAALKADSDNAPWWQWPTPLRDRSAHAIEAARARLAPQIRQVQFQQFVFAQQWQQLKQYAEKRNVRLFGDIPIYVSHDSADVWADRAFFTVNSEGLCERVAGVPPDYFSESGQRWGNPLYRWDVLQADNFEWWETRVRRMLLRAHMIRIDHFCGLLSYWAIPAERLDGREGEWVSAPGEALLQALQTRFGSLPLVAEDLGLITPEVTALRKAFGLPGMKILQFAFGDNPENPYLPHLHEEDSVAYTGTHDNDTSLGWFSAASEQEKRHISDYLQTDASDVVLAMIRSTLGSAAKLAIIPAQDLLGLPTQARFNTPGTLGGNWCWRLESLDGLLQKQAELQQLNRQYDRCSQ